MAFITFIRDITSSAGVLFSQEEMDKSSQLAPATCSPSSPQPENPIRNTKTSEIISLRQSHYGPVWGANIPPYRQLATESFSPSSSLSSSSPQSSVSAAIRTRPPQRSLRKSDFDIQSNQRRPVELPELPSSKAGNPCSPPRPNHHLKSSDGPTTPYAQSTNPVSKYPKSATPVRSITTESVVSIRILGAETTSTHRMDQSSSDESHLDPNSFSADPSPTASPRTTPSPATCGTCRFPLQRTSSESSSLLNLSQRSPLFDDLDEDSASHHNDPSHPDTSSIEDRHRTGSQSSFGSSSPEAFHSLSAWWSDIPPHRRAHIIEAESWPIFTPSVPIMCNGSPPGEQCACPGLPAHDSSTEPSDGSSPEPFQHPQDSYFTSSPPSPRLSVCKNLNLLVPIPLDQNETDPLLSTNLPANEISPAPPTDVEEDDAHDSNTNCHSMKKKKRREESVPKSSESLLTKSLRRLSRKLPNIQWGNLSVRMQNNAVDGKISTTAEEEQEEESVLPSGVVDEDSSVGLAYEDEKAQITRLVKSWTLDNIQPQNSLNGSFINDPEMEWSSMVVQLETFSPSSSKKLRSNLPIQTEKKIPRSSRVQQFSRKSNSMNMESTTHRLHERRRSIDERSETSQEKQHQLKKTSSRRNSRSARNQQHSSNHENKKNSVKITKRVVSNPLHLLQLTLELEMMRKMKINSPLKQRSMKLILIKRSPGSQSSNSNTEFDYVGSPLRFEVL